MRRLSIMQLTDRTCRWPVGDPGTAGFFFCGNDTDLERAYCAVHHKVAHG
jgi:GcrA cell cycle regulator